MFGWLHGGPVGGLLPWRVGEILQAADDLSAEQIEALDLLIGTCRALEAEAEGSQDERLRLALALAQSGILDAVEELLR